MEIKRFLIPINSLKDFLQRHSDLNNNARRKDLIDFGLRNHFSLMLIFCFYTGFSKKIKLTGVVVLTVFYIFSWKGYEGILGWPTSEELPELFNINWVVIQEPNKAQSNEGSLFLWVSEVDEFR